MRSLLLLLVVPCATLMANLPSASQDPYQGAQDQIQLKPLPMAAVAEPEEDASPVAKLTARAEGGDLESQAALGVMYYWGQGVAVDWDKAQIWLRKASERGHRDAQAKLGAMCFLGQGCTANEKEAVKWFQKAADQGEPYSEGCIGVMYAVGEGVEKDLLAAYVWLYQAKAGGDDDAADPLREVKNKLSEDQVKEGTRLAQEAMRSRGAH
jgi:hypothetical protein